MVVNAVLNSLNNSQREDSLWVREFKDGNTNAFNWLVLKHKNAVFNLSLRFLKDYHEANECAQDCFVRVWKYLDGFREESLFTTWLYRIALNCCKTRKNSLTFKIKAHTTQIPTTLPSPDVSAETLLEKKKKGRQVQDCIEKLDFLHREVVLLKDIKGLTFTELQGVTGHNIGTLKSRLARARISLKTCLEGLF